MKTRPAPDEFEVSLFGPGVGEAVVVHIGSGQWLVVDSCLNRVTGNPIAVDYLKGLGYNPNGSIKHIFATHHHNDHIRGLAGVCQAAPDAQFWCSVGVNRKEFADLVKADGKLLTTERDLSEFEKIIDVRRGRRKFLLENVQVLNRSGNLPTAAAVEVWALSPSSKSVEAGLLSIAKMLPKPMQRRSRYPMPSSNSLSVVLWIQAGIRQVLLGGDLESGGWEAVVASCQKRDGKFYKVSHHGSATGDDKVIWSDLLAENPTAFLTPMRTAQLPSPDDLDRLRSNTKSVYCTAPVFQKPKRRRPSVEKTLKSTFRNRCVTQSDTMGHIRIRASMTRNDEPEVELAGPAFKASRRQSC